MILSEQDVRGIATYTRIGLTDEELAQMTVDLNDIIESLKTITEYDLEGVVPDGQWPLPKYREMLFIY